MRVEVDIFSGRPSPFWTASPQEAEALTDLLRLLTGISSRLEEEGGLGYRGPVVTGLPGYGDIRIWNSRVTVGSGEEAKLFADRRISFIGCQALSRAKSAQNLVDRALDPIDRVLDPAIRALNPAIRALDPVDLALNPTETTQDARS